MNGRARSLVALLCSVSLAACGGAGDDRAAEPASSASSAPVEGVLVIKGQTMNGTDDTPAAAGEKTAAKSKREKAGTRTVVDEWPEPELNADGTLVASDDPFASGIVQSQPLPIEEDESTTAAVDAWSRALQRVDDATWGDWLGNGNATRWSSSANDVVDQSIVGVAVQRCGGAQTMASGVVVGDETVVTTVHVIESPKGRVRIFPPGSATSIPAMIRYIDVDDDIAVLKVPGLTAPSVAMLATAGTGVIGGFAYAAPVVGHGGGGTLRRVPVLVEAAESTIDREQPDGFARQISDRSVHPFVGAVDTGFSGGALMATADPDLATGWGLQGIVRARVPFRSQTAGIAVPARLVQIAMAAEARLDEWFEITPGGCPQWYR